MHEATVIILDVRRTDPVPGGGPGAPADPGALADPSGRALDWICHAFRAVLDAELHLVGAGMPWAAPLRRDRACYVTHTDLVFRSCLVDLLAGSEGDIAVAVDRSGEAIGLVRLSPRAVEHVLELRDGDGGRLASAAVPDLIHALAARGLEVRAVAAGGDWAALAGPHALARFVLGTKAETLEHLRPLVGRSRIGSQVRCTAAEWRSAPGAVLARVEAAFGARPLAVRSSARGEDAWTSSAAGRFTSVLDVAPDREALRRAIDEVIASYVPDRDDHQILIQEMLGSVQLSGVVFTRTLTHHMPYYTINYDDATSRTGGVTGGTGKELRTAVIHRDAAGSHDPDRDPRLSPILRAVREIEELVGYDALDLELAVDWRGEIHILQIRPIVATGSDVRISDEMLDEALREAGAVLRGARAQRTGLAGARTAFGVMPDWNPAEIIGICPRRLALGLYRYLVTDEVWATQRAACGYRDVRPHPLLVTIAGHPYVDIRVCFNSFIPASLDEELAGRLVDHYVRRLHRHPHLHDKIEFEVAFTCLAFDFDRRAQAQLRPAGFTAAEIDRLRAGLLGVTREIMRRYPEDLRAIDQLAARHDALLRRRLDPLDRARALLEDCRRHGTLSFAHLARGAFVAVALLRSLVAMGILDPDRHAAFLQSLRTISRSFERDGARVAAGRLSWDRFAARYRHLRPGTYEITCPSYGEDPERYLRPVTARARRDAGTSRAGAAGRCRAWPAAVRRAIGDGLRRLGLPDSIPDLEDFLRATIEGREWSKFVFTRNLSRALDDLAAFAARHGCDRDQLSHVDPGDLLGIGPDLDSGAIARLIEARAREGRRAHEVALCAQLPALVFEDRDLHAFERFRSQPNFVTSRRVVAPLVELSRAQRAGGEALDLRGRLVLVPQADPGYDWLFGHSLAGLITMYGGANSHLAIRAAEANLPAAIGVGELLYEHLARARVLEMDCAGQHIQPIR